MSYRSSDWSGAFSQQCKNHWAASYPFPWVLSTS